MLVSYVTNDQFQNKIQTLLHFSKKKDSNKNKI